MLTGAVLFEEGLLAQGATTTLAQLSATLELEAELASAMEEESAHRAPPA